MMRWKLIRDLVRWMELDDMALIGFGTEGKSQGIIFPLTDGFG